MNQLTEEQQPEPTIRTGGEDLSIFEIMQRYRNDGSCEYVIQDALRRLSLLSSDSQATKLDHSKLAHEIIARNLTHMPSEDLHRLQIPRLVEEITAALDATITAMRDKCVQKVSQILSGLMIELPQTPDSYLRGQGWNFALDRANNEVIPELQSLTLDDVKPGEK